MGTNLKVDFNIFSMRKQIFQSYMANKNELIDYEKKCKCAREDLFPWETQPNLTQPNLT